MRIGVFGGTFDPPHLGHLVLAEEARDQLDLDRVLWLLTPVSPLKTREGITPWEIRLELLDAAIGDNSGFQICRVDIEHPTPHYAYESLRILGELYPGDELIYLIGGDSLHDLPRWERPGELLMNCSQLGVMRRPGADVDMDVLEQEIPGLSDKIAWVEAPLLEISGRMVRKRLENGRPVRYFLPPAVYEMILSRQLYRVNLHVD